VRLESLRGKRVLLHFWATWCGVCRREHAALNAVQASLDEDEALLTIVADAQDVEAVQQVAREEGIAYPILLGTEDVIADYRVDAFPTNYYVDREGKVASSTVGMSNRLAMWLRMALSGL
jgi:thiol-disulfide isomerase/thioredoxin